MSSASAGSSRPLPLRIHLLSLVIGIVLPALVVAGLLVNRVVNDNRAAVQRQLIDAARAQATVVDRELSGTIRALQGLAQSDHLSETSPDLSAFRGQAMRLLHDQPMWFAISLS